MMITHADRGRQESLRLALGRREGPGPRRRDARRQGEIAVGEHPNAMVLSKTARGSSWPARTPTPSGSSTSRAQARVEQISSRSPEGAAGSTPNALALSPDGRTLLVANADNNTVAVVDVGVPAKPRQGFMPTGWYPTGVRVRLATARRVFVLERQGPDIAGESARTAARNARGAKASTSRAPPGLALDRARARPRGAGRRYTKTGLRRHAVQRRDAAGAGGRARRLADSRARSATPSPIKHVFYIIRENRTYDQILGDMPAGNGDPNSVSLARTSRRTRTRSRASSSCSTTSTWTPRSATTAMPTRLAPTRPTSSRRSGRRTTRDAAALPHRRRRRHAQPIRQRRRAADGYIWDACLRAGFPSAATANSCSIPARQERGVGPEGVNTESARSFRGRGAGTRRAHPSLLPSLRTLDPRQPARRRLARGIPGVRGERESSRGCRSFVWANDHTNDAGPASRRRAP